MTALLLVVPVRVHNYRVARRTLESPVLQNAARFGAGEQALFDSRIGGGPTRLSYRLWREDSWALVIFLCSGWSYRIRVTYALFDDSCPPYARSGDASPPPASKMLSRELFLLILKRPA